MAPSASAAAGAEDRASQVSGTNNQVAGVDEADVIENDDKYIYVVSGSRFRVIKAWLAPDADELAAVSVPGEARKLFVEGNRALVFSAVPKQTRSNGTAARPEVPQDAEARERERRRRP